MSNTGPDDLEDENPNEGNLAHLREQAASAKAAQDDAAAARRELLFARAGIDTESKLGKLLYKTWEGGDLDALKAEATDLGLFAAPAPAGPSEQDRAQQDFRRGFAGQAAGAVEAETPNPYTAAVTGFHEAVTRGVEEERARMDAFGAIFKAGVNGDKRVYFNEAEYRQQADAT